MRVRQLTERDLECALHQDRSHLPDSVLRLLGLDRHERLVADRLRLGLDRHLRRRTVRHPEGDAAGWNESQKEQQDENELLAIAKARLRNSVETELELAAEEQNKITRIRLTKLLET